MADYGKTTIGASSETIAAVTKRFCKFTAPADIGELDSITVYANRTATGSGYAIDGAVYTDNAGAPNALVANSAIQINANIARNAAAWYSVNYVTKPTLTPSAVYWLGLLATKASVTYFDAGTTGQEKSRADTLPFDDPFGATSITTHDHALSVYVSYTVGGPVNLASTVAGLATAAGALAVLRPLSAVSAGAAGLTAALTVSGIQQLAGAPTGVAAVSGALSVTHTLAASVSGGSSVSGSQAVLHSLAGISAGGASVSAALYVGGEEGVLVATTRWVTGF